MRANWSVRGLPFPIDFEEVKEKIGLNDEYEEYAIHDYELPFTVDEYTSIGELNRLWEMVSELTRRITIGAICSAHSFFKH